MTFFCVSLTNFRHSRDVCQHFNSKIQVLRLYIKNLYEAMVIDSLMFTSWPSARQWSLILLCLRHDPLRDNGHWFSYVYVMTLCETMVIDFLMFTSRPSVRQWSFISLCSHQDPLWGNGHWFSYLYIKTLCKAMVIVFLYIKTLWEAMVIDFLMFTSRPSTRQWSWFFFTSRPYTRHWSLISLCLHQDSLWGNGHWFSYGYIKALCEVMIIDFSTW